MISAIQANEPKYLKAQGGHVESYFIRASNPECTKSFWIRSTVFIKDKTSKPVAELGFIYCDHNVTVSKKINIDPNHIKLQLLGKGKCNDDNWWDIIALGFDSEIAKPMTLFPWNWMLDGSFPKSKLLTPQPIIRFNGVINVNGEIIDIHNWIGMQGHNWGKEHAHEYVWGQCVFEKQECVVEAFTATIKLGLITSPRMSSLVIRHKDKEYRFDNTFDFWKQRVSYDQDDLIWRLNLSGKQGTAKLVMAGNMKTVACLEYENPKSNKSYCTNSMLSTTMIEVVPEKDKPFICFSDSGMLEFLSKRPSIYCNNKGPIK